jgi:hypothetical protein
MAAELNRAYMVIQHHIAAAANKIPIASRRAFCGEASNPE